VEELGGRIQAGAKNWRTRSALRCPRRYDLSAYQGGWSEGKTARDAIAAKQIEQYKWRAIVFSSGTPGEQSAAKAKADQFAVEIKAMLAAMGKRRIRPPSRG
jgi:hypothetical protein